MPKRRRFYNNDEGLRLFIAIGEAAVDCDRPRIALLLRSARGNRHINSDDMRSALAHVRYIGWPTRRRPNGAHS